MTAPTTTPLYDIELESLMDDEAVCAYDDAPAAYFRRHHDCTALLCAACERHNEVLIRALSLAPGATRPCGICGLHIGPDDIRIRPI